MIKTIIFALLIAAISAAPHRNDDFHCPEDDIANTGCMGPKDCLYPNADDCSTYIQCTVNADNTTGTPVVRPCAPGDLEWNDNKKECDYPSESTCNSGSTVAPTSEPTTDETTTDEPSTDEPSTAQPSDEPSTDKPSTDEPSTAQPSDEPSTDKPSTDEPSTAQPSDEPSTDKPSTDEPSTAQPSDEPSTAQSSSDEPSTAQSSSAQPSTAEPTTEAPSSSSTSGGSGTGSTAGPDFVCPRDDIANTGCKGPKDCLYPNPQDCGSYIQCTVNNDGSGTPVVMPCAPGDLEWNDDKKECDYPSQSTCNRGSTAVPSSEPSTDESSTAQPSNEPSTEEPTPAETSTPEQSTPVPTTEASTPEETTTGGSGGESTPTPAETTTGAVSESNTPEQTTTEQSQTSTLPACRPDDDDNDSDLNLADICGTGCAQTRTVAHPTNNRKYIICSSSNSIEKCAEGLLYSKDQVSCNYAGLVDKNGPSSLS